MSFKAKKGIINSGNLLSLNPTPLKRLDCSLILIIKDVIISFIEVKPLNCYCFNQINGDIMDCLFCKFVSKEFKTDIVFENDFVLAFNDIEPQAPHHILIIPKKHIPSVSKLEKKDAFIMGELYLAAKEIANKLNIDDYRLVINNGEGAGQSVFHIHLHLMAGREFTWPAG